MKKRLTVFRAHSLILLRQSECQMDTRKYILDTKINLCEVRLTCVAKWYRVRAEVLGLKSTLSPEEANTSKGSKQLSKFKVTKCFKSLWTIAPNYSRSPIGVECGRNAE